MFGVWTPISGQFRDALVVKFCNAGADLAMGNHTQVTYCPVPFYSRTMLVRMTDPSWWFTAYYVISEDEKAYRLHGSADIIAKLNNDLALALTGSNVLDYLRFFCFFVRTGGEPFLIVDSFNDLELKKSPSARVRSILEEQIRPPRLIRRNDNSDFICGAAVVFGDKVTLGTFSIDILGGVKIMGDAMIADNLPLERAEAIRFTLTS